MMHQTDRCRMTHIEHENAYIIFTGDICNTLVCRYVSFSTRIRNIEVKEKVVLMHPNRMQEHMVDALA